MEEFRYYRREEGARRPDQLDALCDYDAPLRQAVTLSQATEAKAQVLRVGSVTPLAGLVERAHGGTRRPFHSAANSGRGVPPGPQGALSRDDVVTAAIVTGDVVAARYRSLLDANCASFAARAVGVLCPYPSKSLANGIGRGLRDWSSRSGISCDHDGRQNDQQESFGHVSSPSRRPRTLLLDPCLDKQVRLNGVLLS